MNKFIIKSLGVGLALFAVSNVSANLITNPGFEAGATGWAFGGTSGVFATGDIPTITAFEGTHYACLGCSVTDGVSGNATQSILLPGPGMYTFGGTFKFATSNPTGNFDQGQMSLFLSGAVNEVVGGDPNGFGAFAPCIMSGAVCSGWMSLSKTFNYTGPAAAVLVNVNVQDFANGSPTVLYADALHVEQVPEPGTLSLLVIGLLGIVGLRMRHQRQHIA